MPQKHEIYGVFFNSFSKFFLWKNIKQLLYRKQKMNWAWDRNNSPFAASNSRGTKPPGWRAKAALGQDKQKTYNFKWQFSLLGCVQTDATTPNMVAPTIWELLLTCWQWCANRCNNSQQCWDLQCIVGRIQPVSLCKPCLMRVRGPNNVRKSFHWRKMSDWSIPDHVI